LSCWPACVIALPAYRYEQDYAGPEEDSLYDFIGDEADFQDADENEYYEDQVSRFPRFQSALINPAVNPIQNANAAVVNAANAALAVQGSASLVTLDRYAK